MRIGLKATTKKGRRINKGQQASLIAGIPYSGWKAKGLDGRFYGASRRAVRGFANSTVFAAVVLERKQQENGLFRRSPVKVDFFSDRQMALDTACQWFRKAQNIPADKDIIKSHATLWARPPQVKAISTKPTLADGLAAAPAGEVSIDIVSHPNPETPMIAKETAQVGALVKSQSFGRVLPDFLLAASSFSNVG